MIINIKTPYRGVAKPYLKNTYRIQNIYHRGVQHVHNVQIPLSPSFRGCPLCVRWNVHNTLSLTKGGVALSLLSVIPLV